MAALCLLHEGVWFEQQKYEQAEARYQASLADRHGGLKIEGHAITTKSALSNEISEQMSRIGQTLEAQPDSRKSTLELKVKALEKENGIFQATIKRLEARVRDLEGRLLESGMQNLDSHKLELIGNPKPEGDDDDDFELFGSDTEEDAAEADKLREERLAQYAEKKATKKKVIAKSNLILDIKPWDDETDLREMEKCVRSVVADGLLWGTSKFVPVAYGIKKLQISCVVEDDKIGTDFLEDQITSFEDFVQSMDVIAFNKV